MSKYTIILIILGIIAIVCGILLLLFWTGLFFSLPGMMSGSYCASLGIERVTDREISIRQSYNASEPIQFLDITDADLRDIPELEKAIKKVENRIEFNKQGRMVLSYDETKYYYDFFNNKSLEQHKTKLNEWWFLIRYNGTTYGVSNLMVPESPQEMEITIEKASYGYGPIKITDDDLQNIPKIKDAINEIGTYEISPLDNVGLPEDQWYHIQRWFEGKYREQYGKDGVTWYFHHNDKNYSASFAIC